MKLLRIIFFVGALLSLQPSLASDDKGVYIKNAASCSVAALSVVSLIALNNSATLTQKKLKRIQNIAKNLSGGTRLTRLVMMAQSLKGWKSLLSFANGASSTGGMIASLFCGLTTIDAIEAARYASNPHRAVKISIEFKELADSVGLDEATNIVNKIAQGQSSERVLSSALDSINQVLSVQGEGTFLNTPDEEMASAL